MTELVTSTPPPRPEFRNINALKDLPGYRLPVAGVVSILHRVSGALMFILLPFIIWLFDVSISSEISFARFTALFTIGVAWNWSSFLMWSFAQPLVLSLPGWLFKLVALALIWAYLHHLIAGVRHLWMDVNHSVSMEFGRRSAVVTLVLSLTLCAALGAKLFGLY